MEDGLLSLKWNNHKSTFFHILSDLRKRESYTDATIACEGRFFPVHKLVMSTCSDYFGDIFQRTTCKAPVVILKDIRYQEIESLLDYMYLGEVDVKQSELAGLIKAAECLRIKGLAVPDEDPNSSSKRPSHLSENRSSPSAKRHRIDSDSSDDPHYYASQHSKGQRSHSPLNQSSASSRSHSTSSTPVPSQTAETESLSHVPSQSMPPPSYSESRRMSHQSSSHSLSTHEEVGHEDKNGVPVEFIKVEVDEEKADKSKDKSKTSLYSVLKDDHRGEGGGGRSDESVHEKQNAVSNNYSEYCNNDDDVDKEENEQIEAFNGSEIPGPSGVQGSSQLMGWSEEEGSFPHNLFGTEESSHQQVLRQSTSGSLLSWNNGFNAVLDGMGMHLSSNGFHNYVSGSVIKCSICSSRLSTKGSLIRHMRKHTGDRPYTCYLCSYAAIQKSDLNRHLRMRHSNTGNKF